MNRYLSILDRADAHFASVSASQPNALACRLGCTACCIGLFEISGADVVVLAEGLRSLPLDHRNTLIERATEVLERLDHPELGEDGEARSEFFDGPAADEPCPALDSTGSCSIYRHRPLVCRTFGLPVREGTTYRGEECELNFTVSSTEEKEAAAWDLEWEDAVAGDQLYTVPQAIVLAGRMIAREMVDRESDPPLR